MKKPRGRKPEQAAPAPERAAPARRGWIWIALAAGALAAVFEVYSGALRGPFLLDDMYLPFGRPDAAQMDWRQWVAQRPVLMATFLWNYRTSGTETYSYHLVSIALHWAASILVFVLLRRIQRLAGVEDRGNAFALFGAAVFLLHPVQTEAVAYIASRSDVLSTLFAFAALAVFLYTRDSGIRIVPALAVAALTAMAALSKEQAAALPAVFVLADLLLGERRGWRAALANWKLYAPLIAGGAYGAYRVAAALRLAPTVGFQIEGLSWYEYFFTQCRVIWLYVRLIVFPYGLNVDHDIAISRSLLEPGAAIGFLALLAAFALAWLRRKTWPLALFGLLAMLALLAPTSSFFPIRDVAAERRVYAPLLGFLLIAAEFARRLPKTNAVKAGMAAVVLALAVPTYSRASLYGNSVEFWADSAAKSPGKVRPRFQLAYAQYAAGACDVASREFAAAAALDKPTFELLVDWGHALECAGHADQAVAKLREAAAIDSNAQVYTAIGMVLGKQGRAEEALAELARAQTLDPTFGMIYYNRGNVFAMRGEWAKAAEQYREAVRVEPSNEAARQALAAAEARVK